MTSALIASAVRAICLVVVSAAMTASSAASASNESWMEDNAYAFRNNTLKTLSLPASHDAAMYKQDVRLFEVGVEELRAHVQLAGLTLFHFPSTTGVIEGRELLDILDGLMAAVRQIDRQCVYVPWPVDENYCVEFGLKNLVWGWVGEYYEIATGKPGELSITQNLDLYGQLHSGVRMFDLRPKKQGTALYVHHSQGDMKGIGGDFNYTLPLGFDFPVLGYIGFGTFSIAAGGNVRSLSTTGPALDEVLVDVRRFMEEGHRELVVLKFAAYWRGYNGGSFGEGDYEQLLDMIEAQLGPWLVTADMLPGDQAGTPEMRLADATLADLVGTQGRVLVAFDTRPAYAYVDPELGLWPSHVVSASGDYANADDFAAMRAIQLDWWNVKATGDRFGLWWTLTCQAGNIDCNVRDLADKANPYLSEFIDGLPIPNANGNNINEIWVDFADETDATRIAIRLNPIAINIDIKPDNDQHASKLPRKGNIWVALLSDQIIPLDALRVDMQTVRLGSDGARANHHNVKDINGDGLADLILQFAVPDTGIQCGDTVVQLTGRTFLGKGIIGRDSIQMVGCGKGKSGRD